MTSLDALLAAIRTLHEASPDCMAFAAWPDDLAQATQPVQMLPAVQALASASLPGNAQTSLAIAALQSAVAHLRWKSTYSEAEVGAHFLANYGYIELFGPDGHFHSRQLRGMIGYWGAGLIYGWHEHEAEELYVTLSGAPLFQSEGQADAQIGPGQTRQHAAFQPHAMQIGAQPFLCYALWRGPAMAKPPKMIAA